MPNQQLIDYIKQSREAGVEENTIRQALLGSGFSVQDIEEAMTGLNADLNVLRNIQHQKPPSYESLSRKPSGSFSLRSGIKVFIIILIIFAGLIGSYFVLANYFPQYAKYVQPYLGPVLDPVISRINSITSNLPFIGDTPAPSPTLAPTPTPTQTIDSDGDGLSDSDEAMYRTNPNSSDTDGDGYPDGEEVQNGYNPLGSGKMVR